MCVLCVHATPGPLDTVGRTDAQPAPGPPPVPRRHHGVPAVRKALPPRPTSSHPVSFPHPAHDALGNHPSHPLQTPMSKNNKKVVLVTGGTGLVGKGIEDFVSSGTCL